jgi:hypothetical protein
MTRVELIEASTPARRQRDAADVVDETDPPLVAEAAKAGVSVADPAVVTDQRRPGRRAQVNPALIPLLREPTRYVDGTAAVEITAADEDSDARAAGRGMVVGLVLSVPIWAAIGLGFWFIF